MEGGYAMKVMKLLMVLLISVFLGCTIASLSLRDYRPASPDEKGIKDCFIVLEDAWNRKDVTGILATYHKNAKIMTGRERLIVSKEKYGDMLPKRFDTLGILKYGLPKIKVRGDEAEVEVTLETSKYRRKTLMTFSMLRHKEREWLIVSQRF